MRQLLIASIIIASFTSLQGCAPAIVVGAATTAIIANDRRTTEAFLQDQTIKFRSNDAIYSNKEIGTQVHINVISYDQQVLLTGEAPTGSMREQVEAIVASIPGVKKIHNEIKVQPNSRFESRNNDAMITAKVKGRILRNSNVDPSKIKVVTEHAEVYLLGIVTEEEATASVKIAQQVDGVKRVARVFKIIEEGAAEEEQEISPEQLNQESNDALINKMLDRINNPTPQGSAE